MASTLTRKQHRQLERMLAAEKAAKTPQKMSRRGRSRKVAKIQNATRRVMSEVAQYIKSCHDDVLVPGLRLPSPNYYGPYRKHYVHGRFPINLANTANLHGGIVVNPVLLWMNNFLFEKAVAGADTVCTIPTIYQHSTASIATGLPSSTAGAVEAVAVSGRLPNTQAASLASHVRCLGIHFKIIYTGTFANRGGSIVVFTNPNKTALACQIEGAAAASQPGSNYSLTGEVDAAMEAVQIHPLSDEFAWTWRPDSLEFHETSGFFPFSTVNTGTQGNPQVSDYLPENVDGATFASKGWTTGFELRPAAGTQGALSNYYCEITAEFDLCNWIENDSGAGASTALLTDTPARADPVAQAQVHNALASIHHLRRTSQISPGMKSLATSVLKGAKSLAKNVAVEAMASRMAGLFA